MKAGWKTVKLGEVARYDKAQGIHSGLPYVGLEHIESGTRRHIGPRDDAEVQSSTFLFNPSHVLYGRLRPYLRKVLVPDFAGHCSTEIFPLLPSSELDRSFLSYWLISESTTTAIDRLCNGARMPRANMEQALDLEIPLPPLAEQKRIVALLDEAFAAIDEAKAKAETNNENAKAVFARHLKCVFQDAPEDWIVRTIGDVCALKSGTTVAANIEKSFGDIPYLKVADMNIPANRNEITTSSRFLDKSDVKSANIIPAGSTIFPKRGGAILTNKKRVTTVPICADLNIMAAIPSDVLDSTFLYFYFLGVDMKKLGGGSSIPQINNYDIAPLLVCLPTNIETQRQVARKLADIREKTQTLNMLLEQKLARLSDLKKSLLSQAFAGELNA